MTPKINQTGGITGVIEIIRSKPQELPSLNKYLNFLEKNYNDMYYEVGNKIHKQFYDNIYLNSVNDILVGLDGIFGKVCIPIITDIGNKLQFNRTTEDNAKVQRMKDVFIKLLTMNSDEMTKFKEIQVSTDQMFETMTSEEDVTNTVDNVIQQFRNYINTGVIEGLNMQGGGDPIVVVRTESNAEQSIRRVKAIYTVGKALVSIIASVFGGNSTRRSIKKRKSNKRRSTKKRKSVRRK
jgi:hypothetical protein